MTAAAIGLGAGTGMIFVGGIVMSVLMGVVGSFVAILAFSVLLETPGKYLWQTGVVGAIGGGVYLLCTHRGVDVVPASFFSALAIAFMAHLLQGFSKRR